MLKWVVAAAMLVAAPFAAYAGDAAKGKKVFAKCAGCHQVGPDAKNGAGPALNCIMGKKAGQAEGYKYSKALASSDIVWDEETMNKWIVNAKKVVRGTKMIFPAGRRLAKKDDDRANLIAYLKEGCE